MSYIDWLIIGIFLMERLIVPDFSSPVQILSAYAVAVKSIINVNIMESTQQLSDPLITLFKCRNKWNSGENQKNGSRLYVESRSTLFVLASDRL